MGVSLHSASRPVILLIVAAFTLLLAPGSALAQVGPLALGSVEVTPDGGTTGTHPSNSGGHMQMFFVRNTYATTQTYQFTCFGRVNVTCTGTEPTQWAIPAGMMIEVEVSYTVGDPGPGSLVLQATGPAQDTGSFNIVVSDAAPPTVALRNHNGDNRDRSLCLTSGAGEAAAWQCGDLLVAHGLPGYATMGRERTLTLLYNSAQAVPRPVVTAAVTQAGGTPTQVVTQIWMNGVRKDSASYTGWASGTRQIALPHEALTDSSGIYPFMLVVRNIFPDTLLEATISDTLIVVNRAASRYGAGWTLAGVEELRLNQPGNKILWVGGDGSAKVYRSVATDVWQAAAGAFRDTLRRDPGTALYTRTLRHGIQVKFDAQGRHIQTVNRTGQTTTFTWTGSPARLTSIQVPPGGTGTTYTLAYDGGAKLDRITDPAGRILDVTVVSNRLTQIIDPDTIAYHTDFAYDASGRLTGRTTRRGYTTTFAYANGLRVTKVTIPVGRIAGDTTTAATKFFPWDEKGLAVGPTGQTAVDTGVAYTKIDGPRLSPVADTAVFWVDRWGAPLKTAAPIGATTTVQRGNSAVPALATQVQYADGRIVKLSWNSRANLTQRRDSTWHLADSVRLQTAVSLWTYPTDSIRQDSPDSTMDSTSTGRILTRFAYNTLGLTDSVIAPNGHVTRFFTRTSAGDPLRGVVDSIVERQVPAWDTVSRTEPAQDLRTRFLYNTLGNVIRTTSPSGRVDSLGRDATQRVINAYDPAGHRVEMVYDGLNRLRQSIQHVEGLDSGFSAPLLTTTHYAIDLVDYISDPRGVVRSYEYDFAGRRVVEIDDYGKRDSVYYDRAGLVDSIRPRFYQDSTGRAIRQKHDDAGRLLKRSWPTRDVPGDSVVYAYDIMGRVLTATQTNRKVIRTYYATGAVRSERQSFADGSSPTTVTHAYDRLGRRAWYRSGTAGNAGQRDSIWYSYDAASGELRSISVRWRGTVAPLDSVRLRWDAMGRRDSVIFRNGLRILFAYDADGSARLVCGNHPGPTSPDVFDFIQYHRTVDAEGLVLRTTLDNTGPGVISSCGEFSNSGAADNMTYDSRHQMLTQWDGWNSRVYRYDGSGNMTVRKVNTSVNGRYLMSANHNRLRIHYNAATGQLDDSTLIRYDAAGTRLTELPFSNGDSTTLQGSGYREYWYDGLGRLTGTAEWECVPGAGDEDGPGGDCDWGVFSWGTGGPCRYDPLGRMYDPCQNGLPNVGYDGDNAVRTGSDASSTGDWSFVHGPGLDDPLIGYRTMITPSTFDYLYYATDGEGRQLAVGDTLGVNASTDLGYRNGGKLAGGTRFAASFSSTRQSNPQMFHLSFFRNRFYDQETGRWTQEDPIGVAGGINLYQFNGNNPVAHTDPFGLAPCPGPRSSFPCRLQASVDRWKESIANLGASVLGFLGELSGVAPAMRAGGFPNPDGSQPSGGQRAVDGLLAASSILPGDEVLSIGGRIARGHAWSSHGGEFLNLGVRSADDFAKHIDNVVQGGEFRTLSRGRTAYWDEGTGTLVIHDSRARDLGTAFRPKNGRAYFDNLK